MSSDTVRNLLLAIIAAALITVAWLLVSNEMAGPKTHTTAWKNAHEDAEGTAEFYCTMNGAASQPGDLYSEEYKNCVKDETDRDMEKWEANHPDEIWE